MDEANPYRPPTTEQLRRRAHVAARSSALRSIICVGVGTVFGGLLALPFLVVRVPCAFAGPIIGAIAGGILSRLRVGGLDQHDRRKTMNLRISAIFLICGSAGAVLAGALVLKLAGEPVTADALAPFAAIGIVIGVSTASGALFAR